MEGTGSDAFQLSPNFGAGSARLSLSVKNETKLDYEKEEYRVIRLTVSVSVGVSVSQCEFQC